MPSKIVVLRFLVTLCQVSIFIVTSSAMCPCSLSTLPANGILQDCPPGYTLYENVNRCYKATTEENDWFWARDQCLKEGADLVRIDSQTVNEIVKGLLDTTSDYWIGLSDRKVNGYQHWTFERFSTLDYTNWGSGQPDDRSTYEDCVSLWGNDSFKWYDDYCLEKKRSVCEFKVCPLSYTYLPQTGKCYKVITTPRKWWEARADCYLDNGDLARIDSEEAQTLIADMLAKWGKNSLWFGLHDQKEEGTFMWQSESSSNLPYTNWNDTDLINVDEYDDCAVMRENTNYKWVTDECLRVPRAFVCERNIFAGDFTFLRGLVSCVPDGYSTTNSWKAGTYCFMLSSSSTDCPSGFPYKSVYAHPPSSGNEHTFCCRNDAAASKKISLPNGVTVLYAVKDQPCQTINGKTTKEYVCENALRMEFHEQTSQSVAPFYDDSFPYRACYYD